MTKLKTLLACFAVLLLFSCSDDDKNNNEIKLQKPKITREEFKYFKKLPKLIPKKKGNVSSKNSASEIYEFTIDSTSVTQISYQDKNYFTIAIHRNENLNENSFENLVIVEDLINHNNNAFIIKYFPNDEYFQNLQTTKYPGFKGEITIHKIDYNLISLSYRNDLCITYTQAFCGNNFGPAGPNCYNNQDHGAHIYYKTIEVCSSRSDVPVIVDITDGAGSGFVSGINGGGGSHGTNNSNNLITEPIIMQNRTEQKLLQSFTTIEQNNWWQFVASQETKVQIINYLNQNTTNNVIAPQAEQFVIELIDFYIQENINNEDDLKNKIKQAIANGITSTAEYTHKIFKKLSYLAEEYPSSKSFINGVLETINDAASTVTNTNPHTCTFTDLFNMWLFELGPNPINFNGNTITTNQLRVQEGVNQARELAKTSFQNGILTPPPHGWTYGQPAFYDTMLNENFVTAFLGSYTTTVTIVNTSSGYRLNFHVTNLSTWDSATRFRIDNDNNGVHDGIFPNTSRTNPNDLSMGGNFNQNWYWSEPVN